MHFNRREGSLLVFIVLTWALTPLVLHSLLPRYEEHTGSVMVGGLLVGGIAVVALLMSVARRLDSECRDRLAALGFRVVDLGPDLLPGWIPAEHRDRPGLAFDGFRSLGKPSSRPGYGRTQEGLQTFLFGYLCGQERRREGFIVMRFESPHWNWPEFSCAVGSRWTGIHPIPGWERMRFDNDPTFSESCWLQAPRPDQVGAGFNSDVRRLVLDHPKFRIFASGPVLMLYSADYRLIPGEAETFLEQAGLLATQWAKALESIPLRTE